ARPLDLVRVPPAGRPWLVVERSTLRTAGHGRGRRLSRAPGTRAAAARHRGSRGRSAAPRGPDRDAFGLAYRRAQAGVVAHAVRICRTAPRRAGSDGRTLPGDRASGWRRPRRGRGPGIPALSVHDGAHGFALRVRRRALASLRA